MEKPTPNTNASQANTREGRATSAAPAPWLPNSTSHPRTWPVCGRMNDPEQDEHQDGDDDGPCAGLDLTRDPPFGRFDVGPEGVEVPAAAFVHGAHARG